MRWFFTRPSPLEAGLVEAGEEIISGPEHHVDALASRWDISIGEMDSSLYGMLLDDWVRALLPDVVVFIDPLIGGDRLSGFGYPRDLIKHFRALGRITLVGLTTLDPETHQRYQGKRHKHCLCRLQDFGVWLTNDGGVADLASKARRAALWSDVGGVMAAVAHARGSVAYKGGQGPFRG